MLQMPPLLVARLLAGDFKARVGSDYTSWFGTLGAHGVRNRNENGQRLLELCSAIHLCLVDIFRWLHKFRSHMDAPSL